MGLIVGALGRAGAQPASHGAEGGAEVRSLHAHVGVGLARRLLLSPIAEDRLLGIAQAEALGTLEATDLLAASLDPAPVTGRDLRPLVSLTRALASRAEAPSARTALVRIASLPELRTTPHDDVLAALAREAAREAVGDDTRAGLLAIARDTAALGLARSGGAEALAALVTLVQRGGAPAAAATKALLSLPPVLPVVPRESAASGPDDADREMTAPFAEFLGQLGDLRALPALRAAASAPVEARAAALVARAKLGDRTALAEAEGARESLSSLLREAAAEALVTLGAESAGGAVEQLLGSEETRGTGLRLSMRVKSPGLVRALAAATLTLADLDARASAVIAIGHQGGSEALAALTALAHDRALAGDAAEALARAEGALPAIRALAREKDPAMQRLALRAYAVHRAVMGGARDPELSALAERFAKASEGPPRALGIWVRAVADGVSSSPALNDPAPQVRRGAAMACSDPAALEARLEREADPLTRLVLARGWLASGAVDAKTDLLTARAFAGEPDAPLAAYALSARGGLAARDAAAELLASTDPILRAHVARGLARSPRESAAGQLAEAYAFEIDPAVRKAIVLSLAARAGGSSPPFGTVLSLAMRLDPDAEVRELARRAWTGRLRAPDAGEGAREAVAWVRLLGSDGRPPDPNAGGAMMVGADGFARPFTFDDDGYAVVTGLPAGASRVVLAPRILAAYVVREP